MINIVDETATFIVFFTDILTLLLHNLFNDKGHLINNLNSIFYKYKNNRYDW